MVTHKNASTGKKTSKVTAPHTQQRQQRQQPVGSVVSAKKLTSREFKSLKTMVLWLQERKSYRWLERYTGRKHGWWQQVGAGNRKRIAPNKIDLTDITRLYDIMQNDEAIDAHTLTLLLRVMEGRGIMDAALVELINMIRKNLGNEITQ